MVRGPLSKSMEASTLDQRAGGFHDWKDSLRGPKRCHFPAEVGSCVKNVKANWREKTKKGEQTRERLKVSVKAEDSAHRILHAYFIPNVSLFYLLFHATYTYYTRYTYYISQDFTFYRLNIHGVQKTKMKYGPWWLECGYLRKLTFCYFIPSTEVKFK